MQRVATELYEMLQVHPQVALEPLVLRSSWDTLHAKMPFFLGKVWVDLRRRLARREVDAVLFSSMVTAAMAVPLRRAFDRSGVLAAAIVHGQDVTTPFPPYQRFVPKVFGALDAVLPVSRATGEACLERGLATHKLHVVPNGVQLGRFPPLDPPEAMRADLVEALGDPAQPLPDDALLLCSVGRQVPRKGFAWFIEHVMPRLPENVHYWLAGDGPEGDNLRAALEAQGLQQRVRLLGRVSEEDLLRLYRGADLFVMPNVPIPGDMEGFGVVMLEAGLCGLPAIAARLEGILDVITDGVNGHLIETGDAEGFAAAILPYRADRDALQAFAARAHQHTIDTFGWPAVADQYVQTLDRLRARKVASLAAL